MGEISSILGRGEVVDYILLSVDFFYERNYVLFNGVKVASKRLGYM